MDEHRGRIGALQHFSLGDGPGIRTTVFLTGCPLFCGWCHNPETWLADEGQIMFFAGSCRACGACAAVCPQGAHRSAGGQHRFDRTRCVRCGRCAEACPFGALRSSSRIVTDDEVMAFILEDRPFYGADGGVTLSGGEPLLQAGFCRTVARRCTECGVPVLLDTAASLPFGVIEPLLPYIRQFYVDVKGVDPEDCRRVTGADLSLVTDNLRRLTAAGAEVTARVPVIPGYSDGTGYAEWLAALLADTGVRRVDLLPFHRMGEAKYRALDLVYPYADCCPPARAVLEQMCAVLQRHGFTAAIGG